MKADEKHVEDLLPEETAGGDDRFRAAYALEENILETAPDGASHHKRSTQDRHGDGDTGNDGYVRSPVMD